MKAWRDSKLMGLVEEYEVEMAADYIRKAGG
jgi:hypothetical protein